MVGQSQKIWLECLLLILAAAVAYSPSLWNGFVYDDEVYVLSNPRTHNKLNLQQIFTESFPPQKKDQGLYRPLVTLSFYLDGKMWGFPPAGKWNGFHLTNLFLHALNTCLFILLLRRLGLDRRIRSLSGMVFALHPALAEAVAWISGRAELLGAGFGLLAILTFLRQPHHAGFFFFCIFWILSMLCKETYIILPGLMGLFLWLFSESVYCPGEGSSHKETRKPSTLNIPTLLFFGGICILLVIIFWWIRFTILGNWRPTLVAYDEISVLSRMATSLKLLWHYIGLWLWPFSLSIHHEVQPVSSWLTGCALFMTWFFTFWLAWRTRPFSPWLMFTIGWFWISMLPVSNLIFPIGAVFGERFMYLSTLFFAPAIILGFKKVFSILLKESWRVPVAIGLAACWCPLLIVRLQLRLDDWKSNATLWESASKHYPHSFAIQAPWSEALLREGKFAQAHLVADEALKELEGKPHAYQKQFTPPLIRINAAAQSGMCQLVWIKRFLAANETARNLRPQEALDAYRALIQEFPEQPQTYEAIGDLYMRLNNPMAALQNYEEVLKLGMKSAVIYGKYGQALSEVGKKAEAILSYDEALKINPNDSLTHYNRGVVLGELGDYPGALKSFQTAHQLTPKFIAPHLNAAAILIHLKRYEEACEEIKQVLFLDSNQEQAHELLKKIPASIAKKK